MAYQLSQEQFDAVMRNKDVQAQLQAVGHEVAVRADQITQAEGGTAKHTLRSGIRPGGRAFTYVESSSPSEEFGDDKTKRRRALGRAIRGG